MILERKDMVVSSLALPKALMNSHDSNNNKTVDTRSGYREALYMSFVRLAFP